MHSALRSLWFFLAAAPVAIPAQPAPVAAATAAVSRPGSPTREEMLAGLTQARPIAALDSVFLEELTWMEVRDALRAGKKTVLIAAGGVEANGPYLATGKHNYVLRATTEAIARRLGNALVAPIIPFVPEGNLAPPSGHLVFAGTISLREDTFERLVTEIAASMKVHGFEHIVLLADSGGNVTGMKKVAGELTAQWHGAPTVHYIAEYYDYPGVQKWLETQGIHEIADGIHHEYSITSVMMTVDPMLVRAPQRIAAGKFSVNGVPLAPIEKTIALGRRVVDYRATIAVNAITRLIGPAQ
jgi:creatinine amidohydrolase/Fe(II)-dependent formamide hydrolase-like protein